MKWSKKQIVAFSIYISTIGAYYIESNLIRSWLLEMLEIKEETWGYVIMILIPTLIISILLFIIVYPTLKKLLSQNQK